MNKEGVFCQTVYFYTRFVRIPESFGKEPRIGLSSFSSLMVWYMRSRLSCIFIACQPASLSCLVFCKRIFAPCIRVSSGRGSSARLSRNSCTRPDNTTHLVCVTTLGFVSQQWYHSGFCTAGSTITQSNCTPSACNCRANDSSEEPPCNTPDTFSACSSDRRTKSHRTRWRLQYTTEAHLCTPLGNEAAPFGLSSCDPCLCLFSRSDIQQGGLSVRCGVRPATIQLNQHSHTGKLTVRQLD